MPEGDLRQKAGEDGEADMREWVVPEINLKRCTLCGTCVERCPAGAVEMGPAGPFIARPWDCTYCALCEEICPEGAISLGYEITWGSP